MPEHTTRDGRETDRAENRRPDDERPTLADCDHTNPFTGESFGDAMVYHRGPVVAADGGEAEVTERADAESADAEQSTGTAEGDTGPEDEETLGDIDHTPPRDAEDANRVYERGGETPDDDDV
ncbi:hypothetical protein ACFPYI_18505 [Halomarina salina]|uniref:DUF5709 domain-containing protein n=1 Tax=Halomarina salina TaxID=1872699 RepID=A0ABD5RS18_9EURY|nr:hypothetical protein [Halomarina salina]